MNLDHQCYKLDSIKHKNYISTDVLIRSSQQGHGVQLLSRARGIEGGNGKRGGKFITFLFSFFG